MIEHIAHVCSMENMYIVDVSATNRTLKVTVTGASDAEANVSP